MSTIKTDNEDLVLHAEGVKDVEIQTNGSTKLTVKSSGNVGIGTSSPAAHLHIKSTGDAGIIIEADSDNITETDNPLIHMSQDKGIIYADLGICGADGVPFSGAKHNTAYMAASNDYQIGSISGNKAIATFKSSGNVGIGTTSPDAKLDIESNHSQLRLTDSDDSTYTLFSSSGNKLAIRQNSTGEDHLWLTSAGNVGIGTHSPSEKLQVAGDLLLAATNAEINLKSGVTGTSGGINWTFNSTDTNYASVKLNYDTRGTDGLHMDSGYPITIDATTRIRFAITGSEKMRINSSGIVTMPYQPHYIKQFSSDIVTSNYGWHDIFNQVVPVTGRYMITWAIEVNPDTFGVWIYQAPTLNGVAVYSVDGMPGSDGDYRRLQGSCVVLAQANDAVGLSIHSGGNTMTLKGGNQNYCTITLLG